MKWLNDIAGLIISLLMGVISVASVLAGVIAIISGFNEGWLWVGGPLGVILLSLGFVMGVTSVGTFLMVLEDW